MGKRERTSRPCVSKVQGRPKKACRVKREGDPKKGPRIVCGKGHGGKSMGLTGRTGRKLSKKKATQPVIIETEERTL